MDFKTKITIQNFGDIKKLVDNLEKAFETTKKVNKEIKKVAVDSSKAFDALTRGTAIDRISAFTNKLKEMNQNWKDVGGIKGFNKHMTSTLKDGLLNVKSFAKNMTGIFKGIATGGIRMLGVGLSSLIPIAAGVIAALAPIILVVVAIVAAVLLLKRMWKLNIGGMQTTWFKIMGRIKDIWSKVMIMFDKSLKKLSPMFKIVFKALEFLVLPVLAAIEGLLTGLFAGIQPILDAFAELYKPFADMMDIGSKGEGFKSFLKGIGVAFKVIGYGIRIGLLPLELMIKGIAFLVRGAFKLKGAFDGWLKGHPILEKMYKTIMMILFPVKALYGLFKKIAELYDKIKGVFGGGEQSAPNESKDRQVLQRQVGAMTNQSNQTVNNNNQQVAIHTSAEITPGAAHNLLGSLAGGIGLFNRGTGA